MMFKNKNAHSMHGKNDAILLLLFLVVSVTVILKSLFFSNGYVGADGCNYLSLAQNLLEHGSFKVNSMMAKQERALFAIWPVGYPVLIYLVAKITGLTVFLASKLLSILFVAGILLIFRRLFGDDAPVFSCLILLFPFVEIVSHTFSEVPFIFGMLWYCTGVGNCFEQDKVQWLNIMNITLAGIFLFVVRYVGLFSVGFTGCLILYYFFMKRYKKSASLTVSAVIVFSFACLYLYNNYVQTGYMTGMIRGDAHETIPGMLWMIVRAIFGEMNFLVLGFGATLKSLTFFVLTFTIQVALFFYLVRDKKIRMSDMNISGCAYRSFIAVGCFYYFSIMSARMLATLSNLEYRFMFPGTFLILLGVLGCISVTNHDKFHQYKKFIVVIALISFCFGNVQPFIKNPSLLKNSISYYENIAKLTTIADKIPPGSVVVFGDRNLAYMRTDLSIASPFYTPNFKEQEDWPTFLNRIEDKYKGRRIYAMLQYTNFFMSRDVDNLHKAYDQTVVQFILENFDNELVTIK